MIGAFCQGDRPLGVVAEGHTRHTKDGGLFLNPAGVRDDGIEQPRQDAVSLVGAEQELEGEVIRWLDAGSHLMALLSKTSTFSGQN